MHSSARGTWAIERKGAVLDLPWTPRPALNHFALVLRGRPYSPMGWLNQDHTASLAGGVALANVVDDAPLLG